MKVSGFTFVKDAVKFDFPLEESLKSMLPLVDELIINVGVSSDGTIDIVRSINDPKIRVIETEWDPDFKVRSRILAQQTNIALYECKGDWCLYLQADEVLHEEDYSRLKQLMEGNLDNPEVEGILFDYYHLYGSFNTYINSYHWYRKEVRIIKNHLGITSWRDAQGFRADGNKLNVIDSGAHVYHYGWVRDPQKMRKKKKYHAELHHGISKRDEDNNKEDRFYYEEHIDSAIVDKFNGSHPSLMNERVDNWKYEFKPERFKYKLSSKERRHRITDMINRNTGIKIGEYKNYKLIKK